MARHLTFAVCDFFNSQKKNENSSSYALTCDKLFPELHTAGNPDSG